MTLYLSAPVRHDSFRGGPRDELHEFDKSRSLYEFDVFEEDDEQKAYFKLSSNYDAKQLALKYYDTRIEYACEPINEHSFDKTKSVVTTELGIAAKQINGDWKVEKKAKIKYTENINEPEPELSKPEITLKEPKQKKSKDTVVNPPPPSPPPPPPPRLETKDEFESRVKKDKKKIDAPMYTVTVCASPSDAGTTSVSPDQKSYAAGELVTVTANPASGYVFKNWAGASTGAVNPVAIAIDGNKALTAVFERKKSSVWTVIVVILIIVCGIAGYFLTRPSVESLFGKGKEQFEAQNFTEAVTHFSKAIKRKSDNAEFYGWRGRAYHELKNYEAAVADFKEATRLAPKAAEYQYLLGEVYSDTAVKNYDGAVTAYVQAIKLDPNNANYYFGRARAYDGKKAWSTAIADYTDAIRLDPKDARFWNSRGGDYRNMGDYDKAYADHSEATRLNPSEAKYYNNRGVAQVNRKKYAEAIPDYSEAIRLAPDNARYYNNRGRAYFLNKGLALAVADYCMAAKLDAAYREDCEKLTNPTDSRDGQKYQAVAIGDKIWLAQNMNYRPQGGNSWCYEDNTSNCEKYGRLYGWNTAKTVCMSGWHLPSRKEWKDLVAAAGASSAGKKLKVAPPEWNGTDEYKFSARPGGYRNEDGSFSAIGTDGSWWTVTENSSQNAYLYYMSSDYGNLLEVEYDKSSGLSVRCVMDMR